MPSAREPAVSVSIDPIDRVYTHTSGLTSVLLLAVQLAVRPAACNMTRQHERGTLQVCMPLEAQGGAPPPSNGGYWEYWNICCCGSTFWGGASP